MNGCEAENPTARPHSLQLPGLEKGKPGCLWLGEENHKESWHCLCCQHSPTTRGAPGMTQMQGQCLEARWLLLPPLPAASCPALQVNSLPSFFSSLLTNL